MEDAAGRDQQADPARSMTARNGCVHDDELAGDWRAKITLSMPRTAADIRGWFIACVSTSALRPKRQEANAPGYGFDQYADPFIVDHEGVIYAIMTGHNNSNWIVGMSERPPSSIGSGQRLVPGVAPSNWGASLAPGPFAATSNRFFSPDAGFSMNV